MMPSPIPAIYHDGQVLAHHSVADTALDLTTLVLSITVGSWPTPAQAAQPPYVRTVLQVRYSSWLPEYMDAAESTAANHPQWTGCQPVRPSGHHLFDMDLGAWVDPRTLQDHQAAKWLQVKQARESAINAPLATPYGTFDAHAKARASITDAVLMLQTLSAQGTPQNIDWTLADNTVVTLTTAQMVEVGVLLGQQVQAAYAQARSLRVQIEAATTEQEVGLVVWV